MNILKRMAEMDDRLSLALIFAIGVTPVVVYAAGSAFGFW